MAQSNTRYGVGPHPKPWPEGSEFDVNLLATGDQRNVPDQYRYWSVEAIRSDLALRCALLEIAIENWQRDFNMGNIVRTANAFNVGKVHIIGRRQWNKRGAMMTDKYIDISHHDSLSAFLNYARGADAAVIAVDNISGASNLSQTELPIKSILVFGSESDGISDELARKADRLVQIEQFGSTRSINVGAAASIVMYEWMRQHKLSESTNEK